MSDAKPIDVTPTNRPEIKVTLSQDIATHRGVTSELVFEPSKVTAKALMKFGEPMKTHTKGFGAEAEVHRTINYPAVFHIAAAATGIEEGLISNVSISDAGKIASAVMEVMFPTNPTTTNA